MSPYEPLVMCLSTALSCKDRLSHQYTYREDQLHNPVGGTCLVNLAGALSTLCLDEDPRKFMMYSSFSGPWRRKLLAVAYVIKGNHWFACQMAGVPQHGMPKDAKESGSDVDKVLKMLEWIS